MFALRSPGWLAWRACLWCVILLAPAGIAACGSAPAPGQADTRPATPALGVTPAMPGATALGVTAVGVTQPAIAAATPAATAPPPVQAVPTPLAAAEPNRGARPTTIAAATVPAIPSPTLADGANGAWQTYPYPAGWTASERAGEHGDLTTSFGPSGGGAGIGVIVQPGRQNVGNTDLPNTRCAQVVVGGVTGRRCFDTLSSGVSTTLVAQDRTYTIVAAGRRLDQQIYQRFLDSFALLP